MCTIYIQILKLFIFLYIKIEGKSMKNNEFLIFYSK